MSTQSTTTPDRETEPPVAPRPTAAAFLEEEAPVARHSDDNERLNKPESRVTSDPTPEAPYKEPNPDDYKNLNDAAFGSKPPEDSTESDNEPVPAKPAERESVPPVDDAGDNDEDDDAEKQSDSEEKPIDPLDGMTGKQIELYERDKGISAQANDYARRLADEYRFLAKTGWQSYLRTLIRNYQGISPQDLAAQQEAFIQEQAAEIVEQLLRDWLVLRLIELAGRCQRHIVILNSKGGSGKTPLAVFLASILQWAIKMSVIIYDANENGGTTSKHMGVSQANTKTIRYCINHLAEFTDYAAVSRLLGTPSRTGTFVVSSDKGATKDFTKEVLANVFRTINRAAAHSSFFDAGNGSTAAANEAAVLTATDQVYSARADDPDSFDALLSTMYAYKGLGYEKEVLRAYIAVSKTQPGDTKEMFMEQLREAAKRTLVGDELDPRPVTLEELGISEERLFLVPFDPYIMNRGVADPTAIDLSTLISYLEILEAIFGRPEVEDSTQDTALAIQAVASATSPIAGHPFDDSSRGLGWQ